MNNGFMVTHKRPVWLSFAAQKADVFVLECSEGIRSFPRMVKKAGRAKYIFKKVVCSHKVSVFQGEVQGWTLCSYTEPGDTVMLDLSDSPPLVVVEDLVKVLSGREVWLRCDKRMVESYGRLGKRLVVDDGFTFGAIKYMLWLPYSVWYGWLNRRLWLPYSLGVSYNILFNKDAK